MGHSSAQIFTKFDDGLKERNIKGLKKTYLGVLLSIELNSKTSKIAKGIKEQIKDLIQNVPLSQNLWWTLSSGNISTNIKGQIVVDGEQVSVTLTKQSEDTYNVKFDKNTSKVDVKNVTDYSTKDLLTLCGQHELTIGKDKKDNYVFGVTIKGEDNGKRATVGGPGKILIFPQHLSYIKETIKHLEEGRNPTKEFVLATGTGKTFIELLTQYLPARLMGIPYISLAPNNNLVTQKRDDWKKVLSNADINDIELEKISNKDQILEAIINGTEPEEISGGCSILNSKALMENWDSFLVAIGLEKLPDIIEALNIGDKKFEIRNGKVSIDGKDFVVLADKIQYDDKEYQIQNGKVTINGQEFELNTKKSISLSFDAEHRVAEQELYKYRMEILSALFPTLF
ncbi:MAG: DEAD/DEAH box helicase family protein [Wolbachia sp.]